MRDFGTIVDSAPGHITRAIIVDGCVVLQRFTAPVEIALDAASALDVLMLAEAAQEAGDPVLAKLARTDAAMPAGLVAWRAEEGC